MLHRSSMKYYEEYLSSNGFAVSYCEFRNKPRYKKAWMFDPVDKIVVPRIAEVFENPGFMLTKEHYATYKRMKKEKYMFYWFYMWAKKVVDIIPGIKSKDKENRRRLRPGITIPDLPSNRNDRKYIQESIEYVETHFKNNHGTTDNFLFPVTHATAAKWFDDFIKNRFALFGPYQDAIHKDNDFLFHSCMSSSLNCGLIVPANMIRRIRTLEKKIPLNSYEGFIRQLFWREYQRYCYIYYDFRNKNFFGNKKRIGRNWYDGTVGCMPVDTCIKNAFRNGYLNHIQRLMIIGNFMNLTGINAWEGFKWFMEFSCDSYEWVMYQNVLDMAFCITGGRAHGGTMQKPYISSSHYIRKMGNYTHGNWCKQWDTLYWKFVKKHAKKLKVFRFFITK